MDRVLHTRVSRGDPARNGHAHSGGVLVLE